MLHHMLRAAAQRAFSTLDPYFKYVTMLLHGDGSALGSDTVTPFNSDASTNAFNVTINGDARSNNFNPYQAGYYSNYFGGSGNSLNYPSASQYAIGTGNFTLEFFVNFSSLNAGHNRMFCIGASGTDGLEVDLNGTNLEVGIQNGYPIGYTWTPTAGTWYYVAVTRNGSTVTLYINGTSVATGTSSNSISQNSLSIGGISWVGSWSINGYLSNVRLSNTVRTITTPTTPYTSDANTLFLGAQSNRFLDNSSYAATATPTGSPQVAPAQPFTLPTSVATYGSGYFDGTGDYLTAPTNAAFNIGTNSFTLECWFYSLGSTNYQAIVSAWGTTQSNSAFEIATNGSNLFIQIAYGSSQVSFQPTAPASYQWNHVAMVSNGSTLSAFVNGARVGTQAFSSSINNASFNPAIGYRVAASNYPFLGYIASSRLVNGSAAYDPTSSTLTVPTTPLTAITNTSLLTTQYNGAGNNNGFKDSSQNNFVITRNGNTTQGTFSPYGSNWSNYFNGSSNLSIADNSAFHLGSGAFTIECWFYKTASGNAAAISKWNAGGTDSNAAWDLDFESGNIRGIVASGGSVTFITSTEPALNTWHHAAFVRSGNTLALFVDGSRVGTTTFSGSVNNGTQGVLVGQISPSSFGGYIFPGYISNARVVKGTAVYDPTLTTYTVPTTPLTAITNTSLLTCQSNRFVDNSSNAFAITRNGSPSVQSFSPFVPLVVYNPAVNGGSAYFDGTGDYLTLSSNASLGFGTGAYTVECWVYVTAAPAFSVFFAVSTGGLQFGLNSAGNIAIAEQNVDWRLESATPPVLNAWNHIAATRDSSSATKLFLNGAQIASNTNTTNFAQGTTGNINLNPGNANKFTGYMTDLRVVKGTALYTTSFTPSTVPLTPTAGTSLLLSNTNAGVFDNAMMNDLETVGNAQISTSVKKYGAGSMYFDGSGDWLQAPNNAIYNLGGGDFTIEFWLYVVANPAAAAGIITKASNAGNTGYSIFYYPTGYVGFGIGSGGLSVQTAASSISLATWTHVAITRSGTSGKFFINGTQSGSTGTINNFTDSSTVLAIGALDTSTGWNGNYPLNGYIDDLRITKGVARYTSNFTAPTAAFPNN